MNAQNLHRSLQIILNLATLSLDQVDAARFVGRVLGLESAVA
ncbi:MAG TPA: hypothetical protein VG962_14955 [Steroidobacteraceae bacterium]|nr:hypothetical protein [Steroidobacteraceae bacterium]